MPSVGLVIDSAALAFSPEDVKPRHIGAVEIGAVCADPGPAGSPGRFRQAVWPGQFCIFHSGM